MTRGEEIKIASIDYVRLSNRICPDEQSFFDGAKWADEHPANVWHDSSEKPKENMDILFISRNGKVHITYEADYALYNWLNDTHFVKKWAYLSDLLPKED